MCCNRSLGRNEVGVRVTRKRLDQDKPAVPNGAITYLGIEAQISLSSFKIALYQHTNGISRQPNPNPQYRRRLFDIVEQRDSRTMMPSTSPSIGKGQASVGTCKHDCICVMSLSTCTTRHHSHICNDIYNKHFMHLQSSKMTRC
jgi:hypothetical protein